MLGVLKRRLKPKRARDERDSQSSRRNGHSKADAIVPVDVARLAPSQRQIHPLFDEKAQLLAYDDDNANSKIPTPTPNSRKSPEDPPTCPLQQLPKRSVADSVFGSTRPRPLPAATPSPTFHPAPNICVEGGRIEFIKSPSEGSNLASINPPPASSDNKIKSACLSQCAATPEAKNVAPATRAQETRADRLDFRGHEEKCDFAKEFFEDKVKDLQRLLECEREAVQKERLAVARLQKQLARRDATQRDVDRERRLRADTESRLRETVSESERYRETLAGLQREFSKMEETVRTMLQYKTRCELLNQEKVFLNAIYESRVVQYQNTITKLEQENESLKQRLRLLENIETEDVSAELLERLRSLETENASLFQDADFQIKQYERCLDDIANQVVRALLSQKGLREEIGNLQRRIKELESQNHALADILVNRFDKSSAFALPSTEGKAADDRSTSDIFPGAFSVEVCPQESPATSSSMNFDCKTGERKRLQRLHSSELGDKNILKSLSSFESLIIVPLQRPRSLSLHLHTSPMPLSAAASVTSKRCQSKKGKLNLVTLSKKPSEDEGNESPESGNRDEGYSTMSSDVQGLGETNELSKRELEDLKEASDETEVIADSNGEMTSAVVVEEISDPDMFFIPLNLSLTINSRQSYPPSKNFLPFQHAMRSFSDSHLCLKLTTATVPSALSPSVFFLKKSKFGTNFPINGKSERGGSQSSTGSWCSGNWWDTQYFQHWLKLDDTRLKQQQQQRDMLQLQYDRTEIEEWSMSLSCEDLARSAEGESPYFCKISESSETLPNLTQNKSSPVVGSNQWSTNNCANPAVDSKTEDGGNWIYEGNESKKSTWQTMSPGSSWCSRSTNTSDDCCRALNDCCFNDCSESKSKGSPAVSDDGEESSAIDTDFTRDFYRLVKFESTKSLTSNSSKSNGHCDLSLLRHKQSEFAQDREMALQSVLSFIVEQQRYCHDREEKDVESRSFCESSSTEAEALQDDLNKIEGDNKVDYFCDNDGTEDKTDDVGVSADHLDRLQANSRECSPDLSLADFDGSISNDLGKKTIILNDKNSGLSTCEGSFLNEPVNKKTNGSLKSLNHCSGEREIITKLPVRNFKGKNLVQRCKKSEKIQSPPNFSRSSEPIKSNFVADFGSQNKKQGNKTLSQNSKHLEKSGKAMSEATDALAFQSERNGPKTPSQGRLRDTWIPVSTSKRQPDNSCPKQIAGNKSSRPRTKGTKIPVVSYKKVEPPSLKKPGRLHLDFTKAKGRFEDTNIPVSTGRCTKNSARPAAKTSKPLQSPPSKVVVVDDSSFHEKATTKDVINELNKMIRKGEEVTPGNGDGEPKPLDMACCCPTGWVHVERDIDFADPKARANLLDVMLASSGSSSGSGSSSDSGGDEPVAYNHLHKLHRFRRQRKASATREQLGVLRYPMSSARPSIIGRENFFVRYGDKEKEAVGSFDFLEEISTSSVSGCSSSDSLESNRSTCLKSTTSPTDQELPSPEMDICTPITPTTPVTPSDDSDERTGGPVSLSDSCVESYPESLGSTEEQ